MKFVANVLIITCIGSSLVCHAEFQRDESDKCLNNLLPLAYPPLARAARMMGTVKASFLINEAGNATDLEFSGHPIFRSEIEGAIKRSQFSSTCAGKRIEVVFNFKHDETQPTFSSTSIAFLPPNEYEIRANLTNPINACPLPIQKHRHFHSFTHKLSRIFR